jgi:predicted signal transduction protein with EAL and GGDEF domain
VLVTDAPRYTDGVIFDITERRQTEHRLTHLALHDALTDLPNRALFQEHLNLAIAHARRTGAGGANVWAHDLLRRWLSDRFEALPVGASFRVALRRVTRAGDRIGVPLEDLGVEADEVHELMRRDITDRNADLLAAAAGLLDRSSPG